VHAPVSWSSYSAVPVELFGRHGEQLGAQFRIVAARRLCPSTRLPTGAGHKTEHRATTRRIDPLLRPGIVGLLTWQALIGGLFSG